MPKKVVIDARAFGHHPMELEQSGHGTLLLKIAQACQNMGHFTSIILKGQVEMYQDGIAYWPEDRHPKSGDVLVNISPVGSRDVHAPRVLGPTEIFALKPWVESYEMPKVVGRVLYSAAPNKGLWHLRHIWPKITEQVPDATLCITHNPLKWCADMRWTHDYQGLEAIALSRWVEEDSTVQVHRNLSRSEFLSVQGQAEVLAFPYDPILPPGPSYPTSVMEAAGAGCALLVADSGNAYQVYEKAAGFMPSPLSYDDWADVLVEWLKDRERLVQEQDKARTWASRWSKQAFCKELEEVLDGTQKAPEPKKG